MADETEVRFGILGCAQISIKFCKAISKAPNTKLIAIGSRSLEKATAFASEQGLSDAVRVYGSYEAVLEDDKVDAVYIPLPTALHVTWAVKAAEKGKHVLLEKPVAMNVAELDQILEACEVNGVQFMDGSMWLHHPRTAKMKEALSDEQRFGQLKWIHSCMTYNPGPEFFKNSIRMKPELDGLGALGDIGWYSIQAILWSVITLKLLAMEQLLIQHPEYRGKVVLVQIANPARGRGKDVQEMQDETKATVKRINETFRKPGYDPVILIDEPMKFYERVAYYVVAECCLVTAVRDGMNLIPYEYIVGRQGNETLDKVLKIGSSPKKKSMLVVSEFIGCSPSLSGAIRVNPWHIDAVADAMDSALGMADSEKQLRHEKHYRYVSTHDVGYWARSFLQDLERACSDHVQRRWWGIGFGLSFKVVALDPNFRKLSMDHIVSAYKRTANRAILLDYDGTLMPQVSIDKSPTDKTIEILNSLCRDKNNMVFLVSARSRKILSEWFSPCENIGIAAEHGYFLRMKRDDEWETCVPATDCSWKQIAEPVMKLYTETTDGSTIEDKETALVWWYEDADPDFGSCQAKELLDHLESVLANEPVTVKSGQNYVEVKPQGVSKGIVAKRLLSSMEEKGMSPDFVLCIGDDRSDEDMFEVITSSMNGPIAPKAEVFACTVCRKPSKAKYYLDDTAEIVRLIQGLACVSDQKVLC